MASLRLLVLRFVRDYLSEWGASPSYGEIAAGLNTNRTRVRKAVRSLANDGLLLRCAGPRGLALPDELQGAVKLLAAHGFQVNPPRAESVTDLALIEEPVLDYVPLRQEGPLRGEEAGKVRGGGEIVRRAGAAQGMGTAPSSPRG